MIRIQLATLENIDEIFLLGIKAFSSKIEDIPYSEFTKDMIRKYLTVNAEYCCIAIQENKLIAFSLASGEFINNKEKGHIEWTVVDSEYINSGIGLKLFFKNYQALKRDGKISVVIDTCAHNSIANRMARKFGMALIASVNYYELRCDSIEGNSRLASI